ncbi:MAG: peroxide stress protein YaaA [Pseudomonadota bacterium]|nr:peroxide stress protein YaaA [Pseudomonadota bacterium]
MLLLLSPAKTLDYDTAVSAPVLRHATQPLYADRAAELIRTLRHKSVRQVASLMDLSQTLAELNVERYAAWQPKATAANSKPAVLAFAGDVYTGLDAVSLNTADLRWAQDHLLLLSGLYGALRPLDRLQPYRLEMGTALKTSRGRDLYAYWGDTVATLIDERLADQPSPIVVNLASIEYAKVALRPALQARVVDCVFEDWKDGRYKLISFFAKKARGAMARHAIRKRARSLRALQSFDADGYAYDAEASAPDRLVFRRRA